MLCEATKMRLEKRPLPDAENTILVHNIAYPSGRTAVRKGTTLKESHLATLRELGRQSVQVAVLDPDDVPENDAATALANALKSDTLAVSRAAGGRINFRATVNGLLEVDAACLLALNMIPGVTLATLAQYSVAGPDQAEQDVATLKIIPYAIPQQDLDRALSIARSPGLFAFRALPADGRVALLLTGEPAVHDKLKSDFEPPIRTRLTRLGAELATIRAVPQTEQAIRDAAASLAGSHNLLIVAGQTSIMDRADITPQALTEAGAEVTAYGAPVEPGNLLALAYFPHTPVMCAPGCARNPAPNIVDLILPRLLLGDRLEQCDMAQFGLGGYLK
jgi:hypothetical protein